MRTRAVLALVGLMALGSACGSKPAPVIVTSVPAFPDVTQPPVPETLRGTTSALAYDLAWRFLQAGDLKNAERELTSALESSGTFFPAHAALGDIELIRKDPKAALPHFERAITLQPDYVPALVGKGEALVALNRDAEAASAFDAAVAVDGTLVDLHRRADVLRFRGLGRDLEAARQAARAGKPDEARRLYQSAIAGSPDSAFLYRELATVERQSGDTAAALAHLQKATQLDPSDADSFLQIGELLEGRREPGDIEGALTAYAAALAIEPSEAVETRRDALRDALRASTALARMPDEYRAIADAPQVTRAELAALIGVRLAPLLQAPGAVNAVVVTDVRANWAESWIMAVVRARVMDAYDNHTFQPRALVRRVDLAQAVSVLLQKIAVIAPAQPRPWDTARVTFTDIQPSHLAFPAASKAVAAGAMARSAEGAFLPASPVTGAEALETIGRVEKLANLPAARPASAR